MLLPKILCIQDDKHTRKAALHHRTFCKDGNVPRVCFYGSSYMSSVSTRNVCGVTEQLNF